MARPVAVIPSKKSESPRPGSLIGPQRPHPSGMSSRDSLWWKCSFIPNWYRGCLMNQRRFSGVERTFATGISGPTWAFPYPMNQHC